MLTSVRGVLVGHRDEFHGCVANLLPSSVAKCRLHALFKDDPCAPGKLDGRELGNGVLQAWLRTEGRFHNYLSFISNWTLTRQRWAHGGNRQLWTAKVFDDAPLAKELLDIFDARVVDCRPATRPVIIAATAMVSFKFLSERVGALTAALIETKLRWLLSRCSVLGWNVGV